MTVTTELATIRHTGNGVTTAFSIPFKFLSDDHIQVTVEVTATGVGTIISPADYTLSGAGDDAGGTLTYNPLGVPVPSTKVVQIDRIVPITQDLDIEREGGFNPEAIEAQLDLIVMQVQYLQAQLALAISGDTITSITQGVAGPASSTANNFVGWNGTTGALLKDSGYNAASFATAAHTHSFGSLTGTPTTIAGYGITDFDDEAIAAMALAFDAGTHTNITVDTSVAGIISLTAVGDEWTEKIKSASTTIASSTTLASDADLQFNMDANTTYLVRASVFLESINAVGFKIGATGPSSPTLLSIRYEEVNDNNDETNAFVEAYGNIRTNTPGANRTTHCEVWARIANGVNAGTFALQFAQNVSSGTAITIYSGSTLEYRVV